MRRFILLVEDNPDDQALTMRALKKNNIKNEVVVAGDGKEALDILMAGGEDAGREVEMVLLDLKLPKIDGHGVLREMRANHATRRVPVIVLTSSNEERDILTSYELGANSYIRKPVDFSEFNGVVKQMADYWLGLNVSPLIG